MDRSFHRRKKGVTERSAENSVVKVRNWKEEAPTETISISVGAVHFWVVLWWSRQESNLDLRFRRPTYYPLYYGTLLPNQKFGLRRYIKKNRFFKRIVQKIEWLPHEQKGPPLSYREQQHLRITSKLVQPGIRHLINPSCETLRFIPSNRQVFCKKRL